jgi:hypothetical protein
MALVVSSKVSLEIIDGAFSLFKIKDLANTVQTLNQSFQADVQISNGVSDQLIDLEDVAQAQILFLQANQAISVKFVPVGETIETTKALLLMPNLPTLMSVQNVAQIAVSNNSGALAKLLIQGAGLSS